MSIFLMQRLVRYLQLRNLLQPFLCVNSDMYALQMHYLGSDAVDDCESGGKYSLLERGGENDNFGLSLMPNRQC